MLPRQNAVLLASVENSQREPLDQAARDRAIVYECGRDGKPTVSLGGHGLDGMTVAIMLAGKPQGGTPHCATAADAVDLLGSPSGVLVLLADGAP